MKLLNLPVISHFPGQWLQMASGTSSSLLCGLILAELRTNHGCDALQIVCRDGVRVAASRLMMAAVSPYLAEAMRQTTASGDSLTEDDDCHAAAAVLLMPEVDAADLTGLISLVLDAADDDCCQRVTAADNLEQRLMHAFDGLLWEAGYLTEYLVMKKEEELVVEYVAVDDDVVKSEEELVADGACPAADVFTDKSESDTQIVNVKIEKQVTNSAFHKLGSDNDEASDKEEFLGPDSPPLFPTPKRPGPRTRKRKAAVKSDHNNSVSGSCVKRPRKRRSAADVADSKKRKRKAVEEGGLKTRSQQRSTCSFEAIADDDPRIQDTDFREAQARLRSDLEDARNLEDPRLLWHRHHGLNPKILQIRYQDKHPPLVCPICRIYIPPQNANMCYGNRMPAFFNHLREHKYSTYVCGCSGKEEEDRREEEEGEGRKERTSHLELVHWQWTRCSLCPKVFPPSHEARHMNFSHKRPLVCQFCSRTVITQCYWNHMDSHNMDKTCRLCDHPAEFKSLRQREHHIQSVHIRTKLCCDLCYFICLTEAELTAHKEEFHGPKVKVTAEKTSNNSRSVVCDVCGDEVRKRDYSWHKRKHDSRLTTCRVCNKEMPLRSLARHLKDVHNPREVCTICGVEVKKMKSHVAIFHTPYEQAKHKCELCRKCFDSSSSLKNHNMNMHLKLRPYKCRYGCEFAYNDTSNRNSHEKKKHGQLFTATTTAVTDNKDFIQLNN